MIFSPAHLECELFNYVNEFRSTLGSPFVGLLESRKKYYFDNLYKPKRKQGILTRHGVDRIDDVIGVIRGRRRGGSKGDGGKKKKMRKELKYSLKCSRVLNRCLKEEEVFKCFGHGRKNYSKSSKEEKVLITLSRRKVSNFASAQQMFLSILLDDFHSIEDDEEEEGETDEEEGEEVSPKDALLMGLQELGKELEESLKNVIHLLDVDSKFDSIGLRVNNDTIRIMLYKYSRIEKIIVPEPTIANPRRGNEVIRPFRMEFVEKMEFDDNYHQQRHSIKDLLSGKKEIRNGDVVIDHESNTLDFKVYPSSRNIGKPKGLNSSWIRSIGMKLRDYFISFANTNGGVILFGVIDKIRVIDCAVLEPLLEEKIIKHFDAIMSTSVFPQIECKSFHLKFVGVKGNFKHQKLIALEVKKSSKFYVFKEAGGFRSLQRQTESNLPLDWVSIRSKFKGDLQGKQDYMKMKEANILISNLTSGFRIQVVKGDVGSGKSFLSKKVMEDERVLKYFGKIIWVDVQFRAGQEIRKELDDYKLDFRKSTKRILVVLDDVEYESQFTFLMNFTNVSLLITTRADLKSKFLQQYVIELKIDTENSINFLENKFKVKNLKNYPPESIDSSKKKDKENFTFEEFTSVCKLMQNLKVSDFKQVEATLKTKHTKVYNLIRKLQIFPKNSYVPVSLVLVTGFFRKEDLQVLQGNSVIQNNKNLFRVMLKFRMSKEDEIAMNKDFSDRLQIDVLKEDQERKYFYKYKFFHLFKSKQFDVMESFLTDYSSWIFPKHQELFSLHPVIRDFGYFNLKKYPDVKTLYGAVKAIKVNSKLLGGKIIYNLISQNKTLSPKLMRFIGTIKTVYKKKKISFLYPMRACVFSETKDVDAGLDGGYFSNKKIFFFENKITSSTFHKNLIVLGCDDQAIRIFDVRSYSFVEAVFRGHHKEITGLFVLRMIESNKSPVTPTQNEIESKRHISILYSSDADQKVFEWNLATGTKRNIFSTAPYCLKDIYVNSQYIVGSCVHEKVPIIVFVSKVDKKLAKVISNCRIGFYLNNLNQLFAIRNEKEVLKVSTASTKELLFYKHQNKISCVCTSTKNNFHEFLFILDEKKMLFYLSLETGKVVGRISLTNLIGNCTRELKITSIRSAGGSLYLCTNRGRILKVKINPFDKKFMGYYNVLVHETVSNLCFPEKSNDEFVYLIDRHIVFVKKQNIVKSSFYFDTISNHLLLPHTESTFFSVLSNRKHVKLIDVSGTVKSDVDTSVGVKCISRDKTSVYYQNLSSKQKKFEVIEVGVKDGKIRKRIEVKSRLNHLNINTSGRLIAQGKDFITSIANDGETPIDISPKFKLNSFCRSLIGFDDKIFIGSEDGVIEVFSKTGKKIRDISIGPQKGRLFYLLMSNDGKYLISLNESNRISVFNLSTNLVEKEFLHKQKVMALSISPNNKFLATSCVDFIIRVFGFRSKRLICSFYLDHFITSLTFLKTNKSILVAGSKTGNVFLFGLKCNFRKRRGRFITPLTPIDVIFGKGLNTTSSSESFNPKHVNTWNIQETSTWLVSKNIDFSFLKYGVAFENHHINGEVLFELKEDHLKEIGIQSVGHRLLILKYIQELQKKYFHKDWQK